MRLPPPETQRPRAPRRPDPPPWPRPRPTLAERYDLSCSVSSGATLRYSDHDDQRTRYGKLRVGLGCGARLGERISLRVSLVRYPVPGQQAPWDPDFTYDLSYRVTDRLSLSYSSYTARFSGDGADVVSSLFDGSLRAALRLPPVSLPLGEGGEMSCTLGMALPDPREGSATLGCAAPLTDKLRVGLTAYALRLCGGRAGGLEPGFHLCRQLSGQRPRTGELRQLRRQPVALEPVRGRRAGPSGRQSHALLPPVLLSACAGGNGLALVARC